MVKILPTKTVSRIQQILLVWISLPYTMQKKPLCFRTLNLSSLASCTVFDWFFPPFSHFLKNDVLQGEKYRRNLTKLTGKNLSTKSITPNNSIECSKAKEMEVEARKFQSGKICTMKTHCYMKSTIRIKSEFLGEISENFCWLSSSKFGVVYISFF